MAKQTGNLWSFFAWQAFSTACWVLACRVSDAPALGCAILGSVAAGLHPSIQAAVEAMVHVARVVQPDPRAHREYQRYYRAYKALVSMVRFGV